MNASDRRPKPIRPPERIGYQVSWFSAMLFFGMLFLVMVVPLI